MRELSPPSAKDVASKIGGMPALASAAGVNRTTPYSWSLIPAEHVKAISDATGIPAAELRPDLAAAFAPQPERAIV